MPVRLCRLTTADYEPVEAVLGVLGGSFHKSNHSGLELFLAQTLQERQLKAIKLLWAVAITCLPIR